MYIYICHLIKLENNKKHDIVHSGKGIVGRRSHYAKLFERIEHSGSR